MEKGVKITFNDGDFDKIDPVVEERNTGEYYIVHNGYYEYKYENKTIKNIEYYEL